MDTLKEHVKILGLSAEEAEVYLTALELGPATVLQITQNGGIPRTTVYLIIESLLAKGLFSEMNDGKKKLLVAASPDMLLKLAENHKQAIQKSIDEIKKDLPQLQAVYNVTSHKPRIYYYEGKEKVLRLFEDIVEYPEVYFHCMSEERDEIMGDDMNAVFDKMSKKLTHTKHIISDTKENKAYQKNYSTLRNEVVCIPKQYSTGTDYIIFGDCVSFITYKAGKPLAIVIEDKEIVHFEKVRFMMIYEMAKNKE